MTSCLLSVLGAVMLAATPGVASGPQVGADVPDVKIVGISGPQAGKDFALAAEVKKGSSLIVIAQRPSREARYLLRTLDWYAASQGGEALGAHLLFVEDPEVGRDEYQKLAKGDKRNPPLKTPVGLLDAKNAALLKLHDKTALTVLLLKEGKVSANFAWIEPNQADAARVVATAAKLLGKAVPTLQVTNEKENVVASKLEGTWQPHAELWKRMHGNDKPPKTLFSFKSDPTVAAKIPIAHLVYLHDKPVFMAGTMRMNEREHPFILTTLHGNPHLIWFRPRGGDPLGDSESFNLFLSVAKETQNDLLFIGGDFNNQPFSAWERVK